MFKYKQKTLFSKKRVILICIVFVIFIIAITQYKNEKKIKSKQNISSTRAAKLPPQNLSGRNLQAFCFMNITEDDKKRLFNGAGDIVPHITQNGLYVAFTVSTDKLYILNTKTSQRVIISIKPSYQAQELVWSPDGKVLAYSGSAEAFLINANGSNKIAIEAYSNNRNLWSPDGQTLAVFYYKPQPPHDIAVALYNREGKKTETYSFNNNIYIAEELYWSPFDNRIYFPHSTYGTIYALWSTNITGTDTKMITGLSDEAFKQLKSLPQNSSSPVINAKSFLMSNDGKTIFTLKQTDTGSEVWELKYDGTNSKKIDTDPYGKSLISSIQLAPDGKYLNIEYNDGTSYALDITHAL